MIHTSSLPSSEEFVRCCTMEDAHDMLSSDVMMGELICTQDIQVAINEGNRQRHAFFVVKLAENGVGHPYQQWIPASFSKYHPKLHLEDTTLELSSGRSWPVTIHSFRRNVCKIGKGWRQFAVENHLRKGHQLLFHLASKSNFLVYFFDHKGKSHDSFPPRGEDEDYAPDLSPKLPGFKTAAAKPPRLPVAAFPCSKPRTRRPIAPALNSDVAKGILRQALAQAHPNMVTEDVGGGKEGGSKEQATKEGKVNVFNSSDDDDELPVKQESLPRTPMMREQGGFDEAETHSGDTRSSSCSRLIDVRGSDSARQRPPARKKSDKSRASWESAAGHDHRGSHEEKSSSRDGYLRDHGPTASGVESHFPAPLSPANALLTQQGCQNYSELIVSKRRRGYVTDAALQSTLTGATRYAAGLETQSFLVVMEDHHVYHGFQLSIPREFLEATGTLRAAKVRVCLMDKQRKCYQTKWKWHANCQTPFLNFNAWALFAVDHMLEEGDVCVFELVGSGRAFLFSVHIFKVLAAERNRDGRRRS